jgi:hypothetical protein
MDPLLCETIVAGAIFEKQSKGKTARERTDGVEDGFPRVRLHKICHLAMVVCHHGDMGKNKKRTEVTQQQKIAL